MTTGFVIPGDISRLKFDIGDSVYGRGKDAWYVYEVKMNHGRAGCHYYTIRTESQYGDVEADGKKWIYVNEYESELRWVDPECHSAQRFAVLKAVKRSDEAFAQWKRTVAERDELLRKHHILFGQSTGEQADHLGLARSNLAVILRGR